MAAAGFFEPFKPVLRHVFSEIAQVKEEISSVWHELDALRNQEQEQERVVDIDSLPTVAKEKQKTAGAWNTSLDAEDRLVKVELDLAELTKLMNTCAKEQDTLAWNTSLDAEDRLAKVERDLAELSSVWHELDALRNQEQEQERVVDIDSLPTMANEKQKTAGAWNTSLDAEDRLVKVERDLAELTKLMNTCAKEQDTLAWNTSLDAEDRLAKVERDLAELTKSMNTCAVEQDTFVGNTSDRQDETRTELDCKEQVLDHLASVPRPPEEDDRERASDKSMRRSLQKVLTSMSTIPTLYCFSESVWVATAWVGHASFVESCAISATLMVNCFIQLYFTILVNSNLGFYDDAALSDHDLDGFLAWRITSAHHVKNYDEITDTSLATRVCDHWPGITASYDQSQHVTAFGSYTGDGSNYDLALGGPGLALLCVMCWLCLVAADVLDNLDFSIALLSNVGKQTRIVRSENWSSCVFMSFSRCAVGCLHMFVVLPRLFIACTLFFAGTRFLLFTSSLSELILNAIALGFILEIDEVLFAFLPQTTRSALRGTSGLEMKLPGKRNVHWRPLLLIVVAFVGWLCYVFVLSDIIMRMQLAQEIMCGGAKHFVYAVDPATGVITRATSSDLPTIAHDSYQFHAVLQFIEIQDSVRELSKLTDMHGWEPEDELLSFMADIDGVQSVFKMNSAEATSVLECFDLDAFYPYMAAAKDVYGNDAVYNCTELNMSCDDISFRNICPHTCKCDVMDSGMYLRTGCSSTCDDLILDEVSSVAGKLFGIGENSKECTSENATWMVAFLQELELSFVALDLWEERDAHYFWNSSYQLDSMTNANGAYAFTNATLSGWLNLSVGNGLCDAIVLLDNLVGTDLCQTSQLSNSLGTLQGLCPKVCGLCSTDGVTDTRMSLNSLYNEQSSMMSSGLLSIRLFEKIQHTVDLVCGESVLGEKTGETDVAYSFERSTDEPVVFSLCSEYTDFDTTLSIHDINDVQVEYNDDGYCGLQSTIAFVRTDLREVIVYVGGYGGATGNFQLSVTCGDSGDGSQYTWPGYFPGYYYHFDRYRHDPQVYYNRYNNWYHPQGYNNWYDPQAYNYLYDPQEYSNSYHPHAYNNWYDPQEYNNWYDSQAYSLWYDPRSLSSYVSENSDVARSSYESGLLYHSGTSDATVSSFSAGPIPNNGSIHDRASSNSTGPSLSSDSLHDN